MPDFRVLCDVPHVARCSFMSREQKRQYRRGKLLLERGVPGACMVFFEGADVETLKQEFPWYDRHSGTQAQQQ